MSVLAAPPRAVAQAPAPERVTLPQSDGIELSGRLVLPSGKGPFPAVIVLSLAGTDDLVERFNRLGFAVLLPNRRGLGGAPELLLRATFDRLVDDVRTAQTYLRSRPEVNGAVIGLVGQGGETMVTALAAGALHPAFVVLVGAQGLRGDEAFRVEQEFLAAQQNFDGRSRAQLDTLVTRLDEIVAMEPNEALRELRIGGMMADAEIRLPRDPASLPLDVDGQVHFFASPWWRDFFAFDPERALHGVAAPTLALLGHDDPVAPYRRQLPGLRAGLGGAATKDTTVCLLPGLVQHAFTPATLDTIEQWLRARLAKDGVVARPGTPRPSACIEDDASAA
jgi:pimeloyl-ACP methyl ester carboxylesterase